MGFLFVRETKEEDAACNCDVERFDRGGHGYGDGVIGQGEESGIDAKSFVAEEESYGSFGLEIMERYAVGMCCDDLYAALAKIV